LGPPDLNRSSSFFRGLGDAEASGAGLAVVVGAGLAVVVGAGLAVVVGAGLLFCWASAELKTAGNSASQPFRSACTRITAATSNNSTAPSTAITIAGLKPTMLLSPPLMTVQL
jgi:hypothetical protein